MICLRFNKQIIFSPAPIQAVMGNSCSSKQQTQSRLEFENQSSLSQQDLKSIRKHGPDSSFATRVGKKPKLNQEVSRTLSEQTSSHPLQKSGHQGVSLPVFYIPALKGYYDGEWSNQFPHGYGKFYFENGSYFEGTFVEGEATGPDCLFIYPDGSYKRGQMESGKMWGSGEFLYRRTNMKYSGNWENDQPHGFGTQQYQDGNQYRGPFKAGKKHGPNGEFIWQNGKVYRGSFKEGFMDGQGELSIQGKGSYEGNFDNNKISPAGRGRVKTATGTYEGPFKNGKMDGEGVFKWNNGNTYSGYFSNGQMDGEGTFEFLNKKRIQGIWKDGENESYRVVS